MAARKITPRKIAPRVVLLLVGGLLLTACGTAAATERGQAPDTPATGTPARGEPVGWHGARLEEPGSEKLIVHFYGGGPQGAPPGPCNPRYEGTAEVARGVLTVTVLAFPVTDEPVACTAIAHLRTVTVELPAPLEGDTAVDGSTGETKPVFDVAALRTPTYLPGGYEFSGEGFPFEPTRLERTWSASDAESLIVAVTDREPQPFEPGEHTVVLDETEINGQHATVWKTRGFDDNVTVTWVEGDHTIGVSSLGSPAAPLTVDELLRVARGLR